MPPTLTPIVYALLAVLGTATVTGIALKLNPKTRDLGCDVLSRTIAWWFMCGVIIGCCWHGRGALTICFALISFQGLREYFAVTRVRTADQRALFWSMFVLLPLQYYLVWIEWYGMFCMFIPVYGFIALTVFACVRGDATDFLARCAKIFFGVVIIVYFVSHVPALATLQIPAFEGGMFVHEHGEFILFLLIVSQGNDVCQYLWGKSLGRHKITPHLSPKKTWEGFIGGVVSSAGIAASLAWLIPFNAWQAAGFGVAIAVLGFAGDIVMSAIKRDAGIKDYGCMLGGHGGILDRIDGLAIAAPVFFHLMRYYGDWIAEHQDKL